MYATHVTFVPKYCYCVGLGTAWSPSRNRPPRAAELESPSLVTVTVARRELPPGMPFSFAQQRRTESTNEAVAAVAPPASSCAVSPGLVSPELEMSSAAGVQSRHTHTHTPSARPPSSPLTTPVCHAASPAPSDRVEPDLECCYICLEEGGPLLRGICACKAPVHEACQATQHTAPSQRPPSLSEFRSIATTSPCQMKMMVRLTRLNDPGDVTQCFVCRENFANAKVIHTRRKLTQRGKFGVGVSALLVVGSILGLFLLMYEAVHTCPSNRCIVSIIHMGEFGAPWRPASPALAQPSPSPSPRRRPAALFWLLWVVVLKWLGRRPWWRYGLQARPAPRRARAPQPADPAPTQSTSPRRHCPA